MDPKYNNNNNNKQANHHIINSNNKKQDTAADSSPAAAATATATPEVDDKRRRIGTAGGITKKVVDVAQEEGKRNRLSFGFKSWLLRKKGEGSSVESKGSLKRQGEEKTESLPRDPPLVAAAAAASSQKVTTSRGVNNDTEVKTETREGVNTTPSAARLSLQELEKDIEIKNHQQLDNNMERASQPGAVFISSRNQSQGLKESETNVKAKTELQGIQRASQPGAVSVQPGVEELTNASTRSSSVSFGKAVVDGNHKDSPRRSLKLLEMDVEMKSRPPQGGGPERASQPGAVYVKEDGATSTSSPRSSSDLKKKKFTEGDVTTTKTQPGAVWIGAAGPPNAPRIGGDVKNDSSVSSSMTNCCLEHMESDVEAKIREQQQRERASQPGAVRVAALPPGDTEKGNQVTFLNSCLERMESDVEAKLRGQQPRDRASHPGAIRVGPSSLSISDAKQEANAFCAESYLIGLERDIERKMRQNPPPAGEQQQRASQPGAVRVAAPPPGGALPTKPNEDVTSMNACLERMESDVEAKLRGQQQQQRRRASEPGAIRVGPSSLSLSDAKRETNAFCAESYLIGLERDIERKMQQNQPPAGEQQQRRASQPGAVRIAALPPDTLPIGATENETNVSSMSCCHLERMESDVEAKIREQQQRERASQPGAIRIGAQQSATLSLTCAKMETNEFSARSSWKGMERDIEMKLREQEASQQPGAVRVEAPPSGSATTDDMEKGTAVTSMNGCFYSKDSDVETKIREQQRERALQPGAITIRALQPGSISSRSSLREMESDIEMKMREPDCAFQQSFGEQSVNAPRRSSLEVLERDIESKMLQQSISSHTTNVDEVKSTSCLHSSSSMLGADEENPLPIDPSHALKQLERRVEAKVCHTSESSLSVPDASVTLHETLPVMEPVRMSGAPSNLNLTVNDPPSETNTSIDDLAWSFPVFNDRSTAEQEEEEETQVLEEGPEVPSTVRGVVSIVACTAENVVEAAVQGIVEEDESEKEAKHLHNRCQRATICAVIVIVVVTLISVLMVIFVSRSNETDETVHPMPYGTEAPTMSPTTEMFSSFVDIFTPLSGLAALQDSSSPQYKALQWLYADYQNPYDDISVGSEKFLQRYILAVFYFSSGGDDWAICNRRIDSKCYGDADNWLSSTDECTWFAISCNDEGLITKVNYIVDKPIEGVDISKNLLEKLYKSIQGVLPAEFRSLHELTLFQVSPLSKLAGSVSSCFSGMTKLETISLPENKFFGTLSASIDIENPSLMSIDLAGNQLSGQIPASITNLKSLRVLRFNNNQLKGTISPELGSLAQLDTFELLSNQLSGSIPLSLYNDHLMSMKLGGNQLQGQIESAISRMTALRYLHLGNSRMGGELPPELYRLPRLIELSLSNAGFEGTLSEEFRLLNQTIRDVILSGNNFVGSVPEAFNYCMILEQLDLSNNPQLVGSISDAICKRRGRTVGSLTLLQVDCAIECTCCGLRQSCGGGDGGSSN